MGLSVVSLRSKAVEASAGATDFDQYFLYFSFFSLLVVGLATETACAWLAVFPAVSARGGHVPLASLGVWRC